MDIQFSVTAAQTACDSLSEQSKKIKKGHDLVVATNTFMGEVWSGILSATILGGLRDDTDSLADVKAFVDAMDTHIANCRENYQITEQSNVKAATDINSMFL